MQAFQNILVAADFSGHSKNAYRAACALAQEDGTRLLVVHVIEATRVAEGPSGGPTQEAALNERLREAYALVGAIDVRYETHEGDPAEELLRAARESRADVIVMGTHGRSGLDRLLAGSVAEAVLRKSECPVLVLHDAPDATPKGDAPLRLVLHLTDFSESADAALRYARALALGQGARLVILHVASLVSVLHFDAPVPLVDPELSRKALDDLRERTDGPDLKYPVEVRLEQGDAAAQALRVAGELGCDLIVVGTHGRSGLARALLGSVAEEVLRGARCPVLAVKSSAPAPAPG